MGLSSSQARLLTLTSRLHSVEGEAHRIQANKLRLANDSDKVYNKYLNALDETSLQTLQTSKKTGADCWISGSLNNLMRYNTSDDYTGNVFYVQDIASGQLYVPQHFADKYIEGMDREEFVTKCDPSIEYKDVDANEHILKTYKRAVMNGYDTAASDDILLQYQLAKGKDNDMKAAAQSVLDTIPPINGSGIYKFNDSDSMFAVNFKDAIKILKTKSLYSTVLSANDKQLIEASVAFMDALYNSAIAPQDTKASDTVEGLLTITTDVSITHEATSIVQKAKDKNYITDTSFSEYNAMLAMLNGGIVTWKGTEYTNTKIYYFGSLQKESNSHTKVEKTTDVYKDITISLPSGTLTGDQILATYANGSANFGSALNRIMNNIIKSANNAEQYLSSIGKTKEDILKYIEYKSAKSDYDSYVPKIDRVPNDSVKAKYYEQIFNAIVAAGGCIGVSDTRAQSNSWVGNMIKSAQVILTAWDVENDILSKTAPSLNTHIQEVSDNDEIEKAGQIYEAELDAINVKDTRFDRRLSVLESERTAITTEMESLKQVMKNNVEVTFKLFT